MASVAVCLRSHPRSLIRPSAQCSSSSSPSHFLSASFSSSSSPPDPDDGNAQNEAGSSKSFGSLLSHLKQAEQAPSQQPPGARSAQNKSGPSFFGDLKSSLKQGDRNLPPPLKQFSFSPGATQQTNKQPAPSLDAIRSTLSRFKSAHPDPRSIGHRVYPPSLTDIYRKNAAESDRAKSPGQSISFLKDHLRQREGPKGDFGMLSRFKDSLNRKPSAGEPTAGQRFIGETSELPLNVFGKELNENSKKSKDAPENELVMDYSMEELGKKLQTLRPEGVKPGENWFSLSELNERLVKLRVMDKEYYSSRNVNPFVTMKEIMKNVKSSEDETTRRKTHQGIQILGPLGGTPSYMLEPPKEHLVEKFFHPDNMSSAEKMKLELKRVRDEFKMSETDCGSTRVQIAQLTTEINHLSKVLHKKDKHSIKGLQGKVQMRKKLLKYLRRTDWDSYCFILSKLGLRDNPGYKQH